jgi:hypothetical protein
MRRKGKLVVHLVGELAQGGRFNEVTYPAKADP